MAARVPNFTPETPEAERLEKVRQVSELSLRQFHARLTEGGGFALSYESVRRYHEGREAPSSYVARVANVFGVSLEWLLLDHGPMWPEEVGRVNEQRTGMMEVLPQLVPGFFSIAGPAAVTAMHHSVNKVLRSLPKGELEALFAEDVAELAARLIRLAMEPQSRLFFRNVPSFDQTTAYYQNIFQAMTTSTPRDSEGKPFRALMAALEPWATPEEV